MLSPAPAAISKARPNLSRPEMRRAFADHVQRLFDHLDSDGSGGVELCELAVHLNISVKEAAALVGETSNEDDAIQGNRLLTREDFHVVMREAFKRPDGSAADVDFDAISEAELERYRVIFESLDEDHSGSIEVRELTHGVSRANLKLGSFAGDDLDFKEFVALMERSKKQGSRVLRQLLLEAEDLRDYVRPIADFYLSDAEDSDDDSGNEDEVPTVIKLIWDRADPTPDGKVNLDALRGELVHALQDGELEGSDDDLLALMLDVAMAIAPSDEIDMPTFWKHFRKTNMQVKSKPLLSSLLSIMGASTIMKGSLGGWFSDRSQEQEEEEAPPAQMQIAPPPTTGKELVEWYHREGDALMDKLDDLMQVLSETPENQELYMGAMAENDWEFVGAMSKSFTEHSDDREVLLRLLQLVYVVGVIKPECFPVLVRHHVLSTCQSILVDRVDDTQLSLYTLHFLTLALSPSTTNISDARKLGLDIGPRFVRFLFELIAEEEERSVEVVTLLLHIQNGFAEQNNDCVLRLVCGQDAPDMPVPDDVDHAANEEGKEGKAEEGKEEAKEEGKEANEEGKEEAKAEEGKEEGKEEAKEEGKEEEEGKAEEGKEEEEEVKAEEGKEEVKAEGKEEEGKEEEGKEEGKEYEGKEDKAKEEGRGDEEGGGDGNGDNKVDISKRSTKASDAILEQMHELGHEEWGEETHSAVDLIKRELFVGVVTEAIEGSAENADQLAMHSLRFMCKLLGVPFPKSIGDCIDVDALIDVALDSLSLGRVQDSDHHCLLLFLVFGIVRSEFYKEERYRFEDVKLVMTAVAIGPYMNERPGLLAACIGIALNWEKGFQ